MSADNISSDLMAEIDRMELVAFSSPAASGGMGGIVGTYQDEENFVLQEGPTTVNDDGTVTGDDRMEVAREDEHESPTPEMEERFFLLFLPDDLENPNLCLGIFGGTGGRGETFCISKNCTTAHRGGQSVQETMGLRGGDVVISKSKRSAFSDVRINKAVLDSGLMLTLQSESRTFSDWSERFQTIQSIYDATDSVVTLLQLKKRLEDRKQGRLFATPAKTLASAGSLDAELLEEDLVAYERLLGTPEDSKSGGSVLFKLDEGKQFDPAPAIAEVRAMIKTLDLGLANAVTDLVRLSSSVKTISNRTAEAERSLEVKIGDVENSIIGMAPSAPSMPSFFNCFSVWSAISSTAKFVSGTDGFAHLLSTKIDALDTKDGLVHLKIDNLHKQLNGKLSQLVKSSVEVKGYAKTYTDAVSRAILQKVKALLASVSLETEQLRSELSSVQMGDLQLDQSVGGLSEFKEKPEWLENFSNGVHDRLNIVEQDLRKYKAENDGEAIQFCSLGLKSFEEASSWLLLHMPDFPIGYIVDAHSVMEVIYFDTVNEGVISNAKGLYKIELDDDYEVATVSSFDTWIPKFLTAEKNISTQRDLKKSVFTRVNSYDQWVAQTIGVQDQIKSLATNFQEQHQLVLDAELATNSLAHLVASRSLILSVAWIVNWCEALDALYKKLLIRLDDKATFHIVTRLMSEIWVQVNKPRQGLHRRFKLTKKEGRARLSQEIFWSMIQTHDVMARFKTNRFVNDPSVTADLVAFLLLNSGNHELELIQKEAKVTAESVKAMARQLKDMHSLAQNAEKAASAAQNRADKAKEQVDSLTKEVKELRNKLKAK